MSRPTAQALALLLAASCTGSYASTYTPTSFVDAPDAVPGDNICASTLIGGACTLRAAVMEANAHAGSDIISLNGGTYVLSIGGGNENASATGDLDVLDGLQILSQAGVLTTIDGGGIDRVFDVQGAGDFVLSGVILRNGAATDPVIANNSNQGGGLRLVNSGSNVIQFCIIEENVANTGGAIWTAASSTLIRLSHLRANKADGNVGASNPEGSAIRASGSAVVRIENSSLTGNTLLGSGVGELGSISINGASLQMFSSTIDGDNRKGISVYGGDVILGNVTITGNTDIGLRWSHPSVTARSLFIRNSIIAGNGADCIIGPQPNSTLDIDGHNIDSDSSCGLSAAPADGNYSGIAIGTFLSPLNLSLPLPARFPLPGGPAHDGGSLLDPTSGNPDACFRYDQLYVDRSVNGRCDIGAVESAILFRNGFEGFSI